MLRDVEKQHAANHARLDARITLLDGQEALIDEQDAPIVQEREQILAFLAHSKEAA